jgi:hypothetical protein
MADQYPDGKINQDEEEKLELKTVVYEGPRDHVLGETGFMDRPYSSGEHDAAEALIKNAEEADRTLKAGQEFCNRRLHDGKSV